VYQQVAAAEIEDAIPFVDLALEVLNAAVTAAQPGADTVEVLQSARSANETDVFADGRAGP